MATYTDADLQRRLLQMAQAMNITFPPALENPPALDKMAPAQTMWKMLHLIEALVRRSRQSIEEANAKEITSVEQGPNR